MDRKIIAVLTTLATVATVPAFAADTGSQPATSAGSAAATPAAPGNIGQTLRQDLTKAGFTDIRIMPEAFIVHAKNSAGEPVMMRVAPDSVTELTEVPGLPHNGQTGGMPSGSVGSSTHAAK